MKNKKEVAILINLSVKEKNILAKKIARYIGHLPDNLDKNWNHYFNQFASQNESALNKEEAVLFAISYFKKTILVKKMIKTYMKENDNDKKI